MSPLLSSIRNSLHSLCPHQPLPCLVSPQACVWMGGWSLEHESPKCAKQGVRSLFKELPLARCRVLRGKPSLWTCGSFSAPENDVQRSRVTPHRGPQTKRAANQAASVHTPCLMHWQWHRDAPEHLLRAPRGSAGQRGKSGALCPAVLQDPWLG